MPPNFFWGAKLLAALRWPDYLFGTAFNNFNYFGLQNQSTCNSWLLAFWNVRNTQKVNWKAIRSHCFFSLASSPIPPGPSEQPSAMHKAVVKGKQNLEEFRHSPISNTLLLPFNHFCWDHSTARCARRESVVSPP